MRREREDVGLDKTPRYIRERGKRSSRRRVAEKLHQIRSSQDIDTDDEELDDIYSDNEE